MSSIHPGADRDLEITVNDLVDRSGSNVTARAAELARWHAMQLRRGVWSWGRSLDGVIGPRTTLRNEDGIAVHGLNFATQDPLSLTSHPALRDAARAALERYGPHATGSPRFAGATAVGLELEAAIAGLVGLDHVVLFPSGWAAAFGTLTALVKDHDHVVIDHDAHPALLAGAAAATPHVHRHHHAAIDAIRVELQRLRRSVTRGAIVVVTESLFPFEARAPDLVDLRAVCHAHDATLLCAVGHDLGVLGPSGSGVLGATGLRGDIDFVVGSLAKTLGTNGGFFATRSADAKQLVRIVASSHALSNALSPLQAAVGVEAIRIACSVEGDLLRASLMAAVRTLRAACGEHRLDAVGTDAAIVPLAIGPESLARLTEARAAARGVLTTLVEEPLVARGTARLALHVMAAHRPEHAAEAAAGIAAALAEARALLEPSREP